MSRRREVRFKQKLLEKVYLDNLRIIGKGYNPSFKKRPISFKRLSYILFTLLIIISGYTAYNSLIVLREGQGHLRSVVEAGNTDYLSIQPSHSLVKSLECLSSKTNPEIPIARMFGLKVKIIMIDPGHGGSDYGSSGRLGTKEKDLVLDIAMRLKGRLERHNYDVLMTRQGDETVSLKKRVGLANLAMTDLFISIHLNYLPSRPINIIETYYFGLSSNKDVLRLAEKENQDSPYSLGEFKKILEKVNSTMKFEESYRLAGSIQRSLFTNIRRQGREVMDFGIKKGPFTVLLGVEMPSVLIEVSCLSNKEEELRLNTETYREEIASYLEAGILDYLKDKGELSHEAKSGEEG